jgi:hypothetical protein
MSLLVQGRRLAYRISAETSSAQGGDQRENQVDGFAASVLSTAAARLRRTRDLPATGDGQRAAAGTVDHGALPTPLSCANARTDAPVGEFLFPFLSRKKDFSRKPARERQAGGGGAKAVSCRAWLAVIAAARRSRAEPRSTGTVWSPDLAQRIREKLSDVISRPRAADPEEATSDRPPGRPSHRSSALS